MKRLLYGLIFLSVLIMYVVPAFADNAGTASMNQDRATDKPVHVGDVTSVEVPESVQKIQENALNIPLDNTEGLDRLNYVRREMMRLSANDEQDEAQAEAEHRRAQEEKLDKTKDKVLQNIRSQVGGNTVLGSGTNPDDFEPDNSHNQGEKLVHGFWTAKHTVAPAGDVDFFWFYADAGDAVEIITKTANPYWASDGLITGPADGDLDPYITVYLPDRSVLVENDDSGAGWDAFASIVLPQSGTYYISIQSSPKNPSIGPYELGLAFIEEDDAEVDNDMASATTINNFEIIKGRTIYPVGDVDYFKFNVPVDYTSLKAAIANTPAAMNLFHGYLDSWSDGFMHHLDPIIDLYDAGGNLVPPNHTGDDRYEPYHPELGYLDAELIYPFLMAGDYYLVVRHDGEFNGMTLPANGVGSYEFSLEMAFPDPYEYDNDPAHANVITDGDVIDDHTIIPHDWDVYVYEGKAGEFIEVSVTTENPCGRLDPIMLLWTKDWNSGQLIQPSWDQGKGLDSYILWGPLPYTGKYYIEVGPDMHIGYSQADDVGKYTISLNTHKFSGGIPWSPSYAMPIDFNVPMKNQILPRIGTYFPKNQFGGFMETMPVWYKFDGMAGENIGVEVSTPVQYRGLCPIWDNDWMDDLNPEVYLVKMDMYGNPVILAYNENLNPNNLYDDAGFQFVLPNDGTFYIVVQTDVIGPIVDPAGPLVQHSYGTYDVKVVRQPRVVDFDSDINLGHPPLKVNFFDHCTVEDDNVIDEFVWDAMYSMNVHMFGKEPYYCYWLQGDRGKHDVLKTGSNIAGSVSELKEEFIVVYEPNGYAPMEVLDSKGDFVKEPWAAAVDADDYCWNGVATVRVENGEQPWAVFKFKDDKTKMVNKLRIKTDAGMGNTGRWAKKVRIMSYDGTPGGHYGELLTASIQGGDWNEFVMDPPVEAAFLKLVVIDDEMGLQGWRQIAEFEAYEDIVLPDPEKSMLSVTTPHLANGADEAQLTLKLVDANGDPITVYDEHDVKFYLWDCDEATFGPLDLTDAANGVYKTTLTMFVPGAYQVVAVAHGAVIKNDIVGDNETIASISFFGSGGQKGELMLVEGSEASKGEGWDNAIDGDREGWDGTVTTKGDPAYAIFKFTNDMQMPINKIGLATDNGLDDDAYEGRQVRHFKIYVSDDMNTWKMAFEGTSSSGEYQRHSFPTVFGKYVKFVIVRPDGGWRQLVEFEVLFDSKDGFKSEETEIAALPDEFALESNYPNPFNPTTTINYQLPEDSHVTLSVYNMVGQKVATLVNQQVNAGQHSVTWEAGNFPSGIYLYRIDAGNFTATKRMLLLK